MDENKTETKTQQSRMIFIKADGKPMTSPIVFKGGLCFPDDNGCIRILDRPPEKTQ